MHIISIFYISFAFLLLYDCSAYSYSHLHSSYNTYYSDYFNSGSNHFNSNYFNSNPFKYISIINSNTFLISKLIYNDNSVLSSNSNSNNDLGSQTYLTRIYSYSYVQSQKHLYHSSSPAYITRNPTFLPTTAPTSPEGTTIIPSITFVTDLTLSNVQTNYLDELAQQSVVIATANSMNISIDFVTFVSSSVLQNRKLIGIQLLSFNLITTTKTSIPLEGKYSVFLNNPSSLFTSLSNTMTTAVLNGVFTNCLVAASLKLNSTATVTASVSSISIIQINGTNFMTASPSSIPTSASPSSIPTSYKTGSSSQTNYYYILLYIFGSFVSFWLLFYITIVFRKFYIKKRIRLRRYMPQMIIRKLGAQNINTRETINAEDIELLIVNNE
jgi:hypothetical protein